MMIKRLQSASMSEEYQQAIDYLYGFVNFEHRRIDQYSAENISLERPEKLLKFLGEPQYKYRSIHIAGTKGKGSVAAMVTACLRASGQRVGLYTSPHLQDFRDRIRIVTPGDGDGRISQEQVVRAVEALKPAVTLFPDLTWYELVTAMAFLHFAGEGVDVAVIEVGLGGRLDATNVITPLVSVITSISLDHTALLGDTLAEIAREKGGIIKPGVPVIVAAQESEVIEQLSAIAHDQNAALTVAGRDWLYEPDPLTRTAAVPGSIKTSQEIVITSAPGSSIIKVPSTFFLGLLGRHQQNNAVVALATLDSLAGTFPELNMETIREGLANVEWPGRLQILSQGPGKPTLLLDCAHNVDSAEKLAFTLANDFYFEDLWLVVGVTVDKDVPGILKALRNLSDRIILTTSSHPRATQPAELLQLAREIGYEATSSQSVDEAVIMAWQSAGVGDIICVTGSIFVVGDLLNHWESLQFDLNIRDQAYSGS